MLASLTMMIGTIFILFFAPNVEVLLVGEILCGMFSRISEQDDILTELPGIPWGVFQTLTTAYASEVSPVVLRPYLTTYVNLCWVMGQFISSGVLRASLQRSDEWGYKIPFAVQWIWPLPILVGCYLAPESPWWEVRRGNKDGARRALERLTSPNSPDCNVDDTLAMIEHTNELEKSLSAGTSYWDCFRGIDRRRTEIVCGVWLVQTLCGTNVMGYSTYFLKQAGLPTVQAFNMSLAQYTLGVVGVLLSWLLIPRAGRRTIYLAGSCCLCTILMITGFISLAPADNAPSKWAIGAMLIVFTFVYDFTVGPVCYSLVSELSSTRLKTKTIVLARIGYNISNTVINVLSNYQLNNTAWNWGAKAAFFWAGTCLLCCIWVFFRLPEPKGRTYGELDILFEENVSPRKFSKTQVDPFQKPLHYTVEKPTLTA
jgi:SP family general alpha glucoside:H+ symporter-like MFS transporter